MVNLLYTELLKLKRSKMFFISILGASVAPILIVVASFLHLKTKTNAEPILFEELFFQGNLYTVIIIGVPLYGVVTAYLFIREYLEDTLKNLLTIPVPRFSLIICKSILLFLWIMLLTMFTWSITLGLGVLFQFEGLSASLVIHSFRQFLLGGALLFVLSSPIIFITLWLKNYVPTIICTIVITLMNVMASNSEHRDLFPWAAAGDIATNSMLSTYPAMYSYMIIGVISVVGWVCTIFYFNRVDVN
ncbi:ABC transporter permease [Bacillus sp. 31A1R]|uniref:ABC transporter permease n=1 Tax=Robertmurraya mangrovi TaxID=3098077 RepID=A0ABU5IVV5_9BACI|nr:ABC transporter permease [Bacillus sp. 31A1R]MDZ5471282.1 ABC transporter permease [Bacillus sp. 31A1R]